MICFNQFIKNMFSKKEIEKSIKNLFERVGEGIINPVPYDTAIVSWIPKLDNTFEPEFPECLQWLRNNQLSDGSWGTDKPTYAYGNVLCTLAAIIALKKWNKNDFDSKIISNGEKALKHLAKLIDLEKYETIGYEILLPMLLNQSKQLKLKVPFEELEIKYLFEEKFKSIKFHQQKYGWNQKHTFWFSLEMISGLTQTSDKKLFALNDILLESNGSVCGSPSATAFYLMTKRIEDKVDIPLTYQYIKDIVDTNKGGVPPLFPSDTFELSFSLMSILMADFPSEHPFLKSAINKLLAKWQEFNGLVGCSSYLPPDIDAIAAFIYVLNNTKIFNNFDSLEKIKKFFNGKYFICFKGERNASISVNINTLIALKSYNSFNDEILFMISSTVDWLLSQLSESDIVLNDKWHTSPFYPISRAIFALQAIDDQMVQTFVNQLLNQQNVDFGWGLTDSTLEETALVSLALCFWFRNNLKQINLQNLAILESIQKYFNEFNNKKHKELWIGKSLYNPIIVVKVFVISAKYSLNKTIDLFKIKLNKVI